MYADGRPTTMGSKCLRGSNRIKGESTTVTGLGETKLCDSSRTAFKGEDIPSLL